MELTTQKELYREVETVEISDLSQIEEVLTELLYVPNEVLKPKIASEIVSYYELKSKSAEDKIQMFVALKNGTRVGFVFCQINQDYKSYSRRCPTFGWLHAHNFKACKVLVEECEKFVRANNFRKLRGPINYPKTVGGVGFQTEGFSSPMMNGVAFNEPGSNVLSYLQELGYKLDAKYSCVDSDVDHWDKGKELDENIMIRLLPLEEIKALKEQILDLAQQSLYSVLADATGGKNRFDEIMECYDQATKIVDLANPGFDPHIYAERPGFVETWNATDFGKVVPLAIFAFDRNTKELVGFMFCQLNFYQYWAEEPLTQISIDTIIIKKEYTGKGIFSALHNIGKPLSAAAFGYESFEGTTIWANNEKAIKSIFPHCSPLRTHYVVQRRILKK